MFVPAYPEIVIPGCRVIYNEKNWLVGDIDPKNNEVFIIRGEHPEEHDKNGKFYSGYVDYEDLELNLSCVLTAARVAGWLVDLDVAIWNWNCNQLWVSGGAIGGLSSCWSPEFCRDCWLGRHPGLPELNKNLKPEEALAVVAIHEINKRSKK